MRNLTSKSSRLLGWMAPAVLVAGLGIGVETPAHAQDGLTRVLVDVANVVFNNGTPYDRNGNYGNDDRLVVGRDAYGRQVYYRQAPYNANPYNGNPYNRRVVYDRYGHPVYDQYGRPVVRNNAPNAPPYGNAYGYYRNGPGSGEHCNKHGKCKSHGDDRRDDGDGDGEDQGWKERGQHDDDGND